MRPPTGIATIAVFAIMVSMTLSLPSVELKSHRHCTKCLPGFGLISLCNSTHRTVCEPCPPRTLSPRHDHLKSCTPCAECGEGQYEDRPCTATRDTFCDSCTNTKGERNEDFYKKCSEGSQETDVVLPKSADASDESFESFESSESSESKEEKLTTDDDPHHKNWREPNERVDLSAAIKLKPSDHEYDINHLIASQKRKAILLMAVSALVLALTAAFVALFVYQRHARRRSSRKQFYSALTDEDRSVIHECAQRLEVEQLKTASKPKPRRFMEDEEPLPITIRENPFEYDNPAVHRPPQPPTGGDQ